jgi:hypothetical protein
MGGHDEREGPAAMPESGPEFAALLARARGVPPDRSAQHALIRDSTPDLVRLLRVIARTRPAQLALAHGDDIRRGVEDALADFFLSLLEGDADVIRRFRGSTRGEWRVYAATTLRRQVKDRAVRQHAMHNGGGHWDLRLDGEPTLARGVADPRENGRGLQRAQLGELARLIEGYRAMGRVAASDVDRVLADALGDERDAGSDEAKAVAVVPADPAALRRSRFRLRSFLRQHALGDDGELP